MQQIKIYISIVFLFAVLSACKQEIADKNNTKTEQIIETIKELFVPDKRDHIFNITITTSGKNTVIKGETSHTKVQFAIDSLMKVNEIDFIDSIVFLPNSSVENKPLAIINLSVANLRKSASLSTELISQVLMGQIVKLLKKEGNWYLAQTPDGYFGWIHKYALTTKTEMEIKEWKNSEKLMVTSIYTHVFFEPTLHSEPVTDLVIGNIIKLKTKRGNYYVVELPDGRNGFLKEDKAETYKDWQAKINATPENIENTAKKFLGVPYMWGGTSAKHLDCSGFTQTVYKLNGIQLKRDASQQVKMGIEIDTTNHFAQMQPGDLLFFGRKATENSKEKASHVGIYIGDTEFIHEAGLVKINSLDSTRKNYNEGRLRTFLRVKRILK